MKADELIARLQEHERLLLLEKRHLHEVQAQGLDDSIARWVVDIRGREIIKLKVWLRKVQRGDVIGANCTTVDRRRRRRPAAREALTASGP